MSGRFGLTRTVCVVVAAVFALLVVCAIFVGVAGGEIEMHVLGPLTGKEERFRRTRGWF
jgi:hypothetical protein